MTKSRVYAIVLIVLAFSGEPSEGFDGKRKGFVLGIGIGYTPVLEWTRQSDDASESTSAMTLSWPIGYGWDDNNAVAFVPAPSSFNSDLLGDVGAMQGIWSVRWYHYFGQSGRSVLLYLGPGYMVFNSNAGPHARGIGFIAGVGYELAKHFQIELCYAAGKTTEDPDDFSHQILTLQITGILY